jgi:hypothetical protein
MTADEIAAVRSSFIGSIDHFGASEGTIQYNTVHCSQIYVTKMSPHPCTCPCSLSSRILVSIFVNIVKLLYSSYYFQVIIVKLLSSNYYYQVIIIKLLSSSYYCKVIIINTGSEL